MKTTPLAKTCSAPARLGRGIVGAANELQPAKPMRRGAVKALAVACFTIIAALGALLAFSGRGSTGSITIQRGPVAVGVTSDGKTIAASLRASDGKSLVELQQSWRAK